MNGNNENVKINISYRTLMDDVPEEISDRLVQIVIQFDNIRTRLQSVADSLKEFGMSSSALKTMDQVRRELALTDEKLSDYFFILAQHQKTSAELFLTIQQPEQAVIEEQAAIKQELKEFFAAGQQQQANSFMTTAPEELAEIVEENTTTVIDDF